MTNQEKNYNKGEWSELYAFVKLLKDGRIYAADENVEKIADQYLPILKIVREDIPDQVMNYLPGDTIKIYCNNELQAEIKSEYLEEKKTVLFERIFSGSKDQKGAFSIPESVELMDKLHIQKIKAGSNKKADIEMQIHDINTGFNPIVGFSVKSDVGSAPTLLNAGTNTRFKYRVIGLTDEEFNEVNAMDKSVCREYMIERMKLLFSKNVSVSFEEIKNETFTDNLMLIDTMLPQIYAEYILAHFRYAVNGCVEVGKVVAENNPLKYKKDNFYSHKFKKLLCASALGMTPGKEWDGKDSATGGYVIIKKDGDVLCYHIYNRDFFEEYLLRNTKFDRPSASRHDYGYLYKEDGNVFLDLNVQIRFK